MYTLVGSFMDWNHYTGEDAYKGHLVNIEDWFYKYNGLVNIEGEFQVCEGNEGYIYVNGDLVTFSEAINGMVEYKVWREVV